MAEATRKRKASAQLKRAAKKPRMQALKEDAIASKLPEACESSPIPYDVWMHHILPLVPCEMAQVAFGFSNLCAKFDFSLVVPSKFYAQHLALGASIRGDYVACCWPSSDVDEQTSVYSMPCYGTKTEKHNRPVFYYEPWFITNYFSETYVWNAEEGSLVTVPTDRYFSHGNEGAVWISMPGADYVFLNYDKSHGRSNQLDDYEIIHDEQGELNEFFVGGDCLLVNSLIPAQLIDLVDRFAEPRRVHLRNHCHADEETPIYVNELDVTAEVPRISLKVKTPAKAPVMNFSECNNAFGGKLRLVKTDDHVPYKLAYLVGMLFNARTGSYVCLYSPYTKLVKPMDRFYSEQEMQWLNDKPTLLHAVNAHNVLVVEEEPSQDDNFEEDPSSIEN